MEVSRRLKAQETELLISEKVGKRKKKKENFVPKKKLIETPSQSNINTVVGEHVSSANYTF